MFEHLASMCEDLGSMPSLTAENGGEERAEEGGENGGGQKWRGATDIDPGWGLCDNWNICVD